MAPAGTTELVVDLPPAGVGDAAGALLRPSADGALELQPESGPVARRQAAER
jgi:hypothetical protein